MPRQRLWKQTMQARFAEGTFERIAAVLGEDEDRTDFVRAAVEREIKHRERCRSSDPRHGCSHDCLDPGPIRESRG